MCGVVQHRTPGMPAEANSLGLGVGGRGVIGSDSVQRSPGKILSQDRQMLVRNIPCLHSCGISEISLLEGTVSNYTHVSAEIRKLG